MIQTAHLVQLASPTGQDRAWVKRVEAKTVVAIADGAGGRSGGAEAADLAVAGVAQQAHLLNSQSDCERLLRSLDATIAADPVAGETTCVVLVITPQQIFGASVGDSGAWVMSPAEIDNLTRNQVRKPFLGAGTASVAGFTRPALEGTLLVATDGLLKYTSQEAIRSALQHPALEQIPNRLLALVRYPSGALPDDVAIVLCRHA